jgi:protein-S-isoprenylcysteine O-methyltransferase Ste14
MTTQAPTTPEAKTLKSLIIPAIRNFLIGVIALGVVLCLVAGTFSYWQGWVLVVVFSLCTTEQGIYLSIKDPALLERRMKVGPKEEQSTGQKLFMVVGFGSLLGLLILSALDHRFGWSQVPAYVSIVGDLLVVLSFVIYRVVFQVNSFTASTIQTFEGQTVASTGPYGIVRHPKYVGDLILDVGIAIALGSWWGLVLIAIVLPALVWRILDEEKLLKKDLPGYLEYTQEVHYRLVPYLW